MTYVGEFQDGGGDGTGLGNQITGTCMHVEELQTLVDQNTTTKFFSSIALQKTKDSCIKAEKLAKRL